MESSRYNNVFLALGYSIFSKRFFHHAIKIWKKRYFAYLMLVVLIISVLSATRITLNIDQLGKNFLAELISSMPTIELNQGILSSKPDKPYLIHLPKTPYVFAVVDTKNQYKKFDQDTALLLFGADKVYIKKDRGQIESFNYEKNQQFILDSKSLQDLYQQYHKKIISLIAVFVWLINFITCFVLYSIYIGVLSIITSTIAGAANLKFNYPFYLKLTCLAATLPSIILAILYASKLVNFNTFLAYIVLQIVYLILAVYFVHDIKK